MKNVKRNNMGGNISVRKNRGWNN